MEAQAEAKIARLAKSETVSFGPLANYSRLTGDDGLPIFTGVQTLQAGISDAAALAPVPRSACSSSRARWRPGCKGRKIALPGWRQAT